MRVGEREQIASITDQGERVIAGPGRRLGRQRHDSGCLVGQPHRAQILYRTDERFPGYKTLPK